MTFHRRIYITRDLFGDGTLSRYVDIWSERPTLIPNFDGACTEVWVGHSKHWNQNLITLITEDECRALYGTVPEFVDQLILAPYRTPRTRKKRKT